MQQILIQTMNNAVASNMEKQVRQEMANTILPSMYCITDWAAYNHKVFSMVKYPHDVCLYIYWLSFVLGNYFLRADIRNS